MKIIRVEKMILSNFQGIKALELNMTANDTVIRGDNATGKTTVANAMTWLLFNDSSDGAKNFSPKTLNEDGEMHNLEHGVEITFSCNDGSSRKFKKIYKEVYKKKRGSNNKEFTGHTTDYFCDTVPLNLSEFEQSIIEFFGLKQDKIKQLMSLNYFAEVMSWQERRRVLLEICGDINDDDVFNEIEQADDLIEFLNNRSVEDGKKIVANQKSLVNKEIKNIPSRIDEASLFLSEIDFTEKELTEEIAHTEEHLKALSNKKDSLVIHDDETVKTLAQRALFEAENDLNMARYAYEGEIREKNNEHLKISSAKKMELEQLQNYQEKRKRNLNSLQNKLDDMKALKAKLYEEHRTISQTVWEESQAICPTCHQTLPDDQIDALKNDFNITKSNKLEAIIERGKKDCSKQAIKALEEEISTLDNVIADEDVKISKFKLALSNHEATQPSFVVFEETDEYKQLNKAVYEAKKALENTQTTNVLSEEAQQIDEEIASAKAHMKQLEKKQYMLENNKQIKKRIKALEKEEKELAKNYEKLERIEFLCEQFIKTKVAMLSDNINNCFETCRFKLFSEQINGGIKEDCEVLVNCDGVLVPYRLANHASKINAGLEIAQVLNEYYQVIVPIFIDNAESVTRFKGVENQLIKLVVDENYKTLTIA